MKMSKLFSLFLVAIILFTSCFSVTSTNVFATPDTSAVEAADSSNVTTDSEVSANIDSATSEDANLSAIDGLDEVKAEEYEADGTLPERQAFMESLQSVNQSYYSTFSIETSDSVNVSDIANIVPSTYESNMPTTGDASALVFLVDFPDVPHDATVTQEIAQNVFFGEEDSLRSFYSDSSYGQLSINGDVQNWYTAAHERDYYVKNGIGTLYSEVLDYYDSEIDYSKYDADNNGYIDGLYLHFAGDDSGWGSALWSYVTYVFNKSYDNIAIGSRVCLLHTLDVATIRHETGHLLGLQDYYSYTIKTCNGNHNWVGPDDMMISGYGEHNAISKMLLGWIDSVKLFTVDGQYNLNYFSQNGDAAIVYPFGESEGDSFFVLQKQQDNAGKDILKVLRVNAKTKQNNNGDKSYVHSNMYGEVPFVELSADLNCGESVTPYDSEVSTHYYNDEEQANTFSGITIQATDSGVDLKIEMAPSIIEPPVIHTTAGVNQITATIDFSVPFAINTEVVPYLIDKDGQRIATVDTKAIFGDSGYYIDKASCVLKVASYREWGFDGKNDIIVGSDQDYLLNPGEQYTLVVPKGAFRTVMGEIDKMKINIVADNTADQTRNYHTISSYKRCSLFITLTDGRAAYAYVDASNSNYPLLLALVSEDGTVDEYTIDEGLLGHVGICQLSDGSVAISAANKAETATVFYKFDLDKQKVVNQFEQIYSGSGRYSIESVLFSTTTGFYSIDKGPTVTPVFYIDNEFTGITEVLADLDISHYEKNYVVGDNILLVGSDTDTYTTASGTEKTVVTNKNRIVLYDKEGTLLASTALLAFEGVVFLGADINRENNIVLAYYDLEIQQVCMMIFDEQLNKLEIVVPQFSTQQNIGRIIYSNLFFKCVDDGYFFCYEYVREYNPKAIVGMFDTETYQQGCLLDSKFNVKSIFDVAYHASAATLGTKGNQFIVGDEYGYYTVNVDLAAEEKDIILSSDVYTVDNTLQTITDVPEGTTVEELLKFMQSNLEDCSYTFRYTHAERKDAVGKDQILSCNYELLVQDQSGARAVVYTFPALEADKESAFKIKYNGYLYNYTATDAELIIPEFVTSISGNDFNNFDSVTSLTTSAVVQGSSLFPKLETLNLLEGCTSVGDNGFSYSMNLKKVVLPNTVIKLDNNAFMCCKGLEEIVIPVSVKRICSSALSYINNENLKITYLGSKDQWEQIDFRKYDFDTDGSKYGFYDWESEFGAYLTFAGSGVYEPTPEFKFSGAALTLYDNLQINFRVNKKLFENVGYVQPYVQFIFGNETYFVTDYIVDGDYYVFNFSDIAPHQINDTIYATLYATYKGTLYETSAEYSVATYCYNMLGKYNADEYAELRTLLVDLLNYGSASQKYMRYRTSELANSKLTEEQAAWGSNMARTLDTVQNIAYSTIENPTVQWKSGGLNLKDSITMRFEIKTESVDGLTVKVVGSGNEWDISSSIEQVEDGVYCMYFNGFNASQMSEPVYITVYKDGVAVSNTLRYSIESYAYAKQNDADTTLADLVKAMMQYGDAAYAYIN